MKKVNVIIFGDSLVYGLMDQSSLGYSLRLKSSFESLKNGIYTFYSLGISGETTQDLLNRFENEAQTRYQRDSDNIIILATGINDSQLVLKEPKVKLNQFQDNILKLIKVAQKYSSQIILIGLTRVDEKKVAKSPWQKDHGFNNERIKEFDSALKAIAIKNNLKYVFLGDVLKTVDLVDGLHPNSRGYQKLYEKIYPVLKSLV